MDKIGIVDTMFARFNMGDIAEFTLKNQAGYNTRFNYLRVTVPGFKDLAVRCKILIESFHCKIVIALGMVGRAEIDKLCAHEASQGIMWAQLLTSTPILEVFVHETETDNPEELVKIFIDRSSKHAINAYNILYHPEKLRDHAGCGMRQGYVNEGAISKNIIFSDNKILFNNKAYILGEYWDK